MGLRTPSPRRRRRAAARASRRSASRSTTGTRRRRRSRHGRTAGEDRPRLEQVRGSPGTARTVHGRTARVTDDPRATRTGTLAWSTTSADTDPRSIDSIVPWPRLPTTTTSARNASRRRRSPTRVAPQDVSASTSSRAAPGGLAPPRRPPLPPAASPLRPTPPGQGRPPARAPERRRSEVDRHHGRNCRPLRPRDPGREIQGEPGRRRAVRCHEHAHRVSPRVPLPGQGPRRRSSSWGETRPAGSTSTSRSGRWNTATYSRSSASRIVLGPRITTR